PLAMMPGPPGAQPGMLHGMVWSVARAAGMPPILTVGEPRLISNCIGGCGAGVGTSAAGCIGAWQCGPICRTLSPLRAAGWPLGLSAWLNERCLPALPWQPEPAWLGLQLPALQLSAQAVATISALAQLRAQVQAQFGLDLLLPAHATALARIVATMNARLALM